MNIRDRRQLKQTAASRLQEAPHARRIVMIYGGITIGMSALVTVVNYLLGLEISQSGGLSNIGIRSMLSSLQTFLPMAQSLILLALHLGYSNVCLRIGRGQYTSPNSLRMGLDRFWALLRTSLVLGFVYLGVLFLCVMLSIQIFLLTPLSNGAMEIANQMIGGLDSTSAIDAAMLLDDATYAAFLSSILPVYVIMGIVGLVFFLPIFYQYRLIQYVIIDNPGLSAIKVLRQSRALMKRNRFHLFRLDLSMWWYFLLSFLASAAGYGDVLLPMVGITFPWSDTVGYFLFYGIYLVLELVIFYLWLNQVSVTYALAYESLLPEKEPENGVVLGNIFQM